MRECLISTKTREIVNFLSLMVESGNLLPQEEESEHSHHSIESVRGTKVLDLRRKRSKIPTKKLESSTRVAKCHRYGRYSYSYNIAI